MIQNTVKRDNLVNLIPSTWLKFRLSNIQDDQWTNRMVTLPVRRRLKPY